MNIGIIGSGHIGGNLGRLWSRAGHAVMFSSRHPEGLQPLVDDAGHGARAGTPAEAARFGEAVLFAIDFANAYDAAASAGPLDGKVVIDTMNPTRWSAAEGFTRLIPAETTASAELARRMPGAKLVKAYCTIAATSLLEKSARSGEARIGVFCCADDPRARRVAALLIEDSGFAPIDCGGLKNAGLLEFGGPLSGKELPKAEAERLARAVVGGTLLNSQM
jgi:predicted dinucleotide-binding enzyme